MHLDLIDLVEALVGLRSVRRTSSCRVLGYSSSAGSDCYRRLFGSPADLDDGILFVWFLTLPAVSHFVSTAPSLAAEGDSIKVARN
jgi:hypothetical protein